MVFYYSDEILDKAGVSNSWLGSVIIAGANCLAVCLITPFVDKVGRKPLLLISGFGMTLSAVAISIAFWGKLYFASLSLSLSLSLFCCPFRGSRGYCGRKVGNGLILWLFRTRLFKKSKEKRMKKK